MNKEEQNIAIAIACGIDPVLAANRMCPNYCESLDACHKMEKALPIEKRVVYTQWLELASDKTVKPVRLSIATTTAAQRSEAFLKTLNLWQMNYHH